MSAHFDYADAQLTAQQLVAYFGRASSLTKASAVAANPAQPWRAPQATGYTTVLGQAVLVPAGGAATLGISETLQDLVRRKVAEVFMFAPDIAGTVIDGADILTFNSLDWRVDHIETLNPDGSGALLYFIGAAR